MNRLMVIVVSLALAVLAGCGAKRKGPVGDWQGKVATTAGDLTVVIHVTRGEDGKLAATLDSPDQGATGIPASEVTFEQDKLTLKFAIIGGSYEGTIQPGDSIMFGPWAQGQSVLPLQMRRVSGKVPEVARPQEPKKPYPYKEEEVTVVNQEAGIKLAGTLTLPDSGGPFPAAVLITGSGPEDRNEAIFGHKPFLVLADCLTRRGIAVLRCDDRGVGKSTGDYTSATTEDLASDALVQVEYLKTRKEVDPARIGLIGHSEGGIIAPIVANRTEDVAFVVLLAGTGLPGDSVLMLQTALIARSNGATDSAVVEMTRLERRILDIVMQNEDTAKAGAALRALFRESLAGMDERGKEALGFTEESIDAQVSTVLTPWFRYFLRYDPRPALRALKAPVLAIIGGKDLQVAPDVNLPAIKSVLEAGGNKDYTVRELPGLNHLFQHAETGAVTEYAKIEETIAPEALELVGDWILEHTRTSGN